jgi:small-conductance mechanosensitive channel
MIGWIVRAAAMALALAALNPPALAQQSVAVIDDVEIGTAPVEFDGAVLFRVRGVSSLPAAVRAATIGERLKAAASDSSLALESLRVEDDGRMSRVVIGGTTLMAIVDADAELEQVVRSDLARVHLARIRDAMAGFRDARSAGALQRDAVSIALATLIAAIAIAVVRRLRRWIDGVLTARLQARIHSLGIQSLELVRGERIWGALRSGVVALQTLAVLTIVLMYVGFVLAQLPWTRGLSRSMTAFVLGPLQVIGAGIVAHIPSLAFLAVLFFLVRLALRVIRLFFEAVGRGTVRFANFDPEWAEPTYKIARIAVIAFGLIVAYPYIPGSQSAAFKGVSLFIGVVFSLGSSTAIANIVAGYMMTYRRAFKVGDRIKVGETSGDVIEMRLQVTHVRSVKNEEIIIPNSRILASDVVNYSSLARADGLILHTTVGIGYEIPWRQVEAMLLLAAERTSGLSREPRPFVLERGLGDFAVIYELNVYCTNAQAMLDRYAELHRHILDVFNEYGVQIMTPAYERDPDQPKVVSRRDWYAPPAREPSGPPEGGRYVRHAVPHRP